MTLLSIAILRIYWVIANIKDKNNDSGALTPPVYHSKQIGNVDFPVTIDIGWTRSRVPVSNNREQIANIDSRISVDVANAIDLVADDSNEFHCIHPGFYATIGHFIACIEPNL